MQSKRIFTLDVKSKIGEQVVLSGFVQAIRDQGGIKFIVLRDLHGVVQCVFLKNHETAFKTCSELSLESVVTVTGLAKEQKQAPNGYEVEVEELEILSKADALPIPVAQEKGAQEVDFTLKLDWRWLDLRRDEKRLIFQVWTELEKGFRNYFYDNNYIQVYTPSFMKSASESGSEVFKVKYFDREAYLAQSPQFYKQAAMAAGFEKVFMCVPVFRAEPSFTTRHMTEFTGWDMEISYIKNHYDVMAEKEQMIVAGMKNLVDLVPGLQVPAVPFPKMTILEVKEKLQKAGFSVKMDADLSPEEEREICRIVKAEQNHDFVFVTDWPADIRAFYHMRLEPGSLLTRSFDLLYKGLEITTGAQREHRYNVLKAQASQRGMNLEELEESYFRFFKYGCPPHGGLGFGPGRFVMKILDLESVKDATFLPRDVKRLAP